MATKAKPVASVPGRAAAREQTHAATAIWPIAAALGVISASGIVFEITLTRVFSVLFQYHFVFLAVSLAILGLSLGAILVRLLRIDVERRASSLRWSLVGLSLSFPLVAVALSSLPTTTSILLHVAVALVPFVLTGMATALIFTLRSQSSGLLYGVDLIGAAIGLTLVLGLLAVLGAFNVVITLGIAVALVAMVMAWTTKPSPSALIAPALCAVASLGLLLFNLSTQAIDYSPLRMADAPPDKTLLAVLRDPSQQARIVQSAWDPFARVDVVETNDDNSKFVFTDGGAGSYMQRFDGNLSTVAGLRSTLEYLPFNTGRSDKTLVLGAGAGKDVLLALLAKSKDITAVEVNPAMVEVTRRFGDYNGHIFDQPGVNVHIGDARTFAETNNEMFDLIYLNLVYSQAAPPASQALAESYVFTREAFRAYLQHLSDDGRLAIIAHNGIEGTRAAITAIAAMSDLGIAPADALNHLSLLMRNSGDPTQRTTVMLMSKQPLSKQNINVLQAASKALGLQPLHLPGVFELGFKPLKDGQPLDKFATGDLTYNLFPTTDDQPFFFKLDPGVPEPITQALALAAALAVVLLVVALALGKGALSGLTGYVAAIGLGFMLIEVPLIHRFQVLLGQPVLSLVIVLGTLLLAGGIGSLMSQRWPNGQLPRRVMITGAVIAGIGVIYLFVWPAISPVAMQWPFAARIALVALMTAPLGVAMGIPFPAALRLTGARSSDNVALLWGVNGAFSALGSALAVWIAISAGFAWAMVAGIAAYLALIAFARRVRV